MRARRRFRLALLLTAAICAHAATASAQPYAWILDDTSGRYPFLQPDRWLTVVNLATGERRLAIPVPEVITVGQGMLTADGAHYLLSTSAGIARVRTDTGQFDRLFGPPVAGTLSQGLPGIIHLVGGGTHYWVDVTDGRVVAQQQVSANSAIAFSPDGARRYEFVHTPGTTTTSVSAHTEEWPGYGSVLWQKTITGAFTGHIAAGEQDVAFSVSGSVDQLVILSAGTGAERARHDITVKGLACCRNNALVVSTQGLAGRFFQRLLTVDLATLQQSIVLDRESLPPPSAAQEVELSADRSLAFWASYSGLQLSISNTLYVSVDLATGTVVAESELGARVLDFDVDARSPCLFDLPTSASVGPAGGVVDIPVTPVGSCDPWSAFFRGDAAIVNGGPHSGAATLRVVVSPASSGVTGLVRVRAVGHTIEIAQAGATPPPPEASGRIAGDRAVVSWTVGTGAQPTAFLIRGGIRGGAMITLATVPAATRTWTSAPLPPGSYVVDVVARNYGGDSPPSNRVELSHGVNVRPDAPVNLSSSVFDDVVSLTWSAATTGPAPEGYLVEAALPGANLFVPVLRVDSPRAYVPRVPSGTWQLRVRALTAAGASDPSNVISVTTTPCRSSPLAPSALQVMPVAGIATFRWSLPPSGGVERYAIEGATTPDFAGAVRVLVSAEGTVADVPIGSGIYFARVRAINACGQSAPSNDVVVYVP